MCGICGFISKKNITLSELQEMNDTMYHRGPDDSGQEIYVMKGGYSIGLAQRRLSIMDLSSLGHQPMHSPDRRLSIVFNGEIYNFKELRDELRDYHFVSNCDTEVIIAAYLKWGIDCINRFNGMFAIAIYDREKEELILIRDRIGKKPLYYMWDGQNLVFASELKPIMAFPGFEQDINREIIPRYLVNQYINAPESIFKNVYKLEPGAYLRYRAGELETHRYWGISETYNKLVTDRVNNWEEARAGLKSLLRDAVKRRMIADVPLGTFLSGGYDSSLITAIAGEISDRPVKTFCIGFEDDKFDEAPYARAIAKHLGTDHTELQISEADMFRQLKGVAKYFDEPFADPSEIPTMLVSGLARQQVTVTLSGDGGDEFFCGYNVYDMVKKAKRLDGAGLLVHSIAETGLGKAFKLENKMPNAVRAISANRDSETKTQFANGNYKRKAYEMVLDKDVLSCDYRQESSYAVRDWQIRRMLLDMDTYLPGDILCKVDRASMKYSLESRCPILDTEVMEYSFRIPHKYKYNHGCKKYILKEIAYDYIPKELLERPKKGFGVPLDKWLRGPLKSQLLDYCNRDYLVKQGIFDPDCIYSLIHNYLKNGDGGAGTGANFSKLCWSFLQFQEWYHTYME